MKRILLAVWLSMACLFQMQAVPAYPRQVRMLINGREIPVRLFGDEHAKRVETHDGYTIVQNDREEWVYAVLDAAGHLSPSSYQVGTTSPDVAGFMSSLPRHLSDPSLLVRQKSRQISRRAISQPAVGQRRILVILMEFPDQKMVKSTDDFDHLFNQVGYSDDQAQGSVRDFFYRASYEQLALSCDVYGPYQSAQRMSHYGQNQGLNGNDKHPEDLFEEAIKKVADETDLRVYDGDNDGFIDNVHIIYAGYGEEAGGPANAIWAHEATFYEPYEIQGLKIDRYSCASELRGNKGSGISRIGPHCHEIGHALGAMDFYDTNYSDGGSYEGTGDWDIMASGSWNNDGITPADLNPYVKWINYGWIEPRALPEGDIIIPPSDTDRDNYYLISKGKEYYLLENRNPKQFTDGLPGKGLLIFHVHPDIESSVDGNVINASYPQKCYVVCAGATKDIPGNSSKDYGDISSDKCPFPGSGNKTEFSASSVPKAFWWDGSDCSIGLHDIQLSSDGNICLNNDSHEAGPVVVDGKELYFDGFESQKDYEILSSTQSSWERVKYSGLLDGIMGRPAPYDGSYSYQLSAKNAIGSSVSAFAFTCPVSSEATEIHLSGFFNSKGGRRLEANHLRVGWHPKGSEEWEYYDYEVGVDDVWTPFVLKIAPAPELEFAFEGTALIGSILALDNLKVEQVVATAIGASEVRRQAEITAIYSLSGQRRHQLEKGINIVSFSDGRVRKVLMK